MSENREQKLVDLCFSMVITSANNDVTRNMSIPDLAGWVAEQLRGCGFDTKPIGSSWGVLKKQG